MSLRLLGVLPNEPICRAYQKRTDTKNDDDNGSGGEDGDDSGGELMVAVEEVHVAMEARKKTYRAFKEKISAHAKIQEVT